MNAGGALFTGLSLREATAVSVVADAIGDAGVDTMEATGIPADRGVLLIQRAEILSLASGIWAAHEEGRGDCEAMLAEACAILTAVVREMTLMGSQMTGPVQ